MANLTYNRIFLGGRICGDLELRTAGNTGLQVTDFNLAVNRRTDADGKTTADFFHCVAWKNQAEFISKYFRKGSSIFLTGELRQKQWTGNDGIKRTGYDVIVTDAHFVDSKSDQNEHMSTAAAPATNVEPQSNTLSTDGGTPQFEELRDDENLPF